MTEEYNFFKDFAGVTESDLEALKCGGKMKAKKDQGGALALGKLGANAVKKLKEKRDAAQLDSIQKAQAEQTKRRQEQISQTMQKRGVNDQNSYNKYMKSKQDYYRNNPQKDRTNEDTPPTSQKKATPKRK